MALPFFNEPGKSGVTMDTALQALRGVEQLIAQGCKMLAVSKNMATEDCVATLRGAKEKMNNAIRPTVQQVSTEDKIIEKEVSLSVNASF